MLLALALMIMTSGVVAAIALPLVRRARPVPGSGEFDVAVYRQQLEELDRDLERGLIDASELASARLEIERRLLAADKSDEPVANGAVSPWLLVVLAFGLPMTAGLIYLSMGSPGSSDMPFKARAAEARANAGADPGHADFAASAARLEQELEQSPGDAEHWLLLARTEAELGQWQKSVEAYRRAMALGGNRADLASSYGEMLVMAADGVVTPEAQQQFAAALARDPGDVPARFYVALAAAQAGDERGAIERWLKLAGDVPSEDVRAEIGRRIAEAARIAGIAAPPMPPAPAGAVPAAPGEPDDAGPGPSASDMANAGQMSDEDRQVMIRSMVERLATRLQSEPDDLEGWLRLGRAYGVLDQRDKAIDAYQHAQALLPPGSDRQPAVAAAIDALRKR